jgi:hypothetical protein
MILKPITVANHGYTVEYQDECPICHYHSQIRLVCPDMVANGSEVQLVFQCAFTGCMSFFIGYYGPKPQKELKALKPVKPNKILFPDVVSKLSPMFISIYQEAE